MSEQKSRTVQIVRTPPRIAPFQIDFPASVVDVNGRPSEGSVHFVADSLYELSIEQFHHIKTRLRSMLPNLVALNRRQRPIDEPEKAFKSED